jgi:hypothetical protein
MFLLVCVFCGPKQGNVINKYMKRLLGDQGRPELEAEILTAVRGS